MGLQSQSPCALGPPHPSHQHTRYPFVLFCWRPRFQNLTFPHSDSIILCDSGQTHNDWTCDKQITKLVYPGIVFLQLLRRPKCPQQRGTLIAHLQQWPFQLDSASDLVPRWCLSSLITVCRQGKELPAAPTALVVSVWTCLNLLLQSRTEEQKDLFHPLDGFCQEFMPPGSEVG